MSAIEKWSTTAASNNDAPPDGAPEGMNKSDVNDTIREIMAALRTWYQDPEFLDLADAFTVTRVTAAQIKIAGTDATGYATAGRRIRVTGGGETDGEITSSSFSSPDTLVNVKFDLGVGVPVGTDTILFNHSKSLPGSTFTPGTDPVLVQAFG